MALMMIKVPWKAQELNQGIREVNLQVVVAHEILQPDFGNLPRSANARSWLDLQEQAAFWSKSHLLQQHHMSGLNAASGCMCRLGTVA